jgi:predicted DCC family thiol-disulfide oxidoreductase YuxK
MKAREETIMNALDPSAPVLLYDGTCGFCNKSIQIVLRHDRQKTMRFAALQSRYAQAIVERHPELAGVDSLILIERDDGANEERVFIRSTAALRVAGYLGGPWRLLQAFLLVPRPLRDYFYDQFARRRHLVLGKSESCLLPSTEERARFLDGV